MKASDAKKLSQSSKADKERERAKKAAQKKQKDREDYWNGYRGFTKGSWALEEILNKIKNAAKEGKESWIYRSSESPRNGSVSDWTRGRMDGLKNALKKLDYTVELVNKSRYEPDPDYHGDTYRWIELHIEW